ncbi:MAG TPA: hypothetical protein VHE80_04850 [Acidimicrobiales bacterium]|nr:hypothetical protein [Acidimicrobiales bacterium]
MVLAGTAVVVGQATSLADAKQGSGGAERSGARRHEEMLRDHPGMGRMHEAMLRDHPGMARMHEEMLRDHPGMTGMSGRMTTGTETPLPACPAQERT